MLLQHPDAAQFLQRVRPFLESHEAENNLILGISAWLASHPERVKQPPYFVTVEESGNVEAAAMMTPPHNLVLSRAKKMALKAIVEHAFAKNIRPPGANGPSDISESFAKLWANRTGCTPRLERSLRIYQLTAVTPPHAVKGRLRLASESDIDTVIHWVRNLSLDIGQQQKEEDVLELARQLLADQRLFLWDDDGLRSMAAWSGPTTHGVRINFVYTPPEHRGNGYASACVAALSQRMLDSGRKFCCLFTDLANSTSNHIYQRIGYRQVCDYGEYGFT